MKITTFKARDMREALKEVKEKLGSDAVILSTRSIREPSKGGIALGRTLIEVTACPSPTSLEETTSLEPEAPARFSRVVDDPIERTMDPPPLSRQDGARQDGIPRKKPLKKADISHIHSNLRALEDGTGGALNAMVENSGNVTELDSNGKRHYGWMLMHGVEEPIARRIALSGNEEKERGLTTAFLRSLKFHDPLNGKARVIALVGPTGVGKTTTLAKIAADLILNKQRSVGMITLDTFRVGAVAQLDTYAKLLQVRLVVARALSDVKAGLQSLNRCDYVLVDTVGSSPYNRRQVNSTAGLLPVMGEDREVILCMAANVRETEQQAIYRRFSVLKPTGLIFTKLDETVTYGGILNVAVKANLPLTLYTDGQRVPENLGWMSAKSLAKWFEQDLRQEE